MSDVTTILGADLTATPPPESKDPETPSPPAPSEGGETQDKPKDGEPADKSPAEPKGGDEGKGAGESKEGDKPAEDKEGDKPAGAPETYELKAPEGQPELDAKVLDTYSAAARKLNLTNEGAQSILNEVMPALEAQRNDVLQAARTEWDKQSRTDKQFGGENYAANLKVAERGLDRFGSPALKQFLTDTGIARYPEMIRFCFNAGSKISEDKGPVKGGSGETGAEVDLNNPAYVEATLYPNHPKKTV